MAYLKRLLLRNFRNYKSAEVAFSPSINLVQGENGQGKTNLLEAVQFVSTGRSFRTAALSDLIHFGETFFYIEAEFFKDNVTQSIKIYYDETTRKVQYNETIQTTLTSLLGILPSVLLSPDDLSLISGSPAERRRFLDIHIAQTDPLYLHHLGRYFKAMKHRNHLLRAKNETTIDAWEQAMAISASYLVQKRKEAASALKDPSSKWMQTLSSKRDEIELSYHSSLNAKKDFHQLWQKSRHKDMLAGMTSIGPHRDDLSIEQAHGQAKSFSSEGQKRTCISALRFAQWELMAGVLGHSPLLGIDDFGLQLDPVRQEQLKTFLPQFKQVFLTSPVPIDLKAHVLTISQGNIS